MQPESKFIIRRSQSVLATNTVLRKTYALLACTLLFSAVTAMISMQLRLPQFGFIFTLIGYFALLYLTTALRNNPVAGLVAIFAFTGFLGLTLGPMLEYYITTLSNGPQLIMTALGGTGVIFFVLSAYTLTTKKDFSYLGGFLLVTITCAFLLGLAAAVFQLPLLSIGVSAAFMLLSSGIILYKTSEIVHGGETNYIMATLSLYIALLNIFLSLLRLLSLFGGNRN